MTPTISPERRAAIECLLADLAGRVDGAIDFWTIVCLFPEDSTVRRGFLIKNARALRELLGQVEADVAAAGREADEAAQPTLAGLRSACESFLEVFLVLERFRAAPPEEVRLAVNRLRDSHAAWKRGVRELGAVLGVKEGWQGKSLERVAYIEGILARLSEIFSQALASEQQPTGIAETPTS